VLTIGEQIMETLSAHTPLTRQEIQERTVELLTRVEIPAPSEKIFHYPHQLSGGMRQRVMIAMALACEPRILIADEPTTALDVLVQAQIMDLLEKLKQQTGMSILLITHDLGVVHEVADRMLVMYAGEIVEAGPVSSIFQSPWHPYTLGLKKSVPVLQMGLDSSRRLDEIPGQVPNLRDLPKGCAFHPRCPWAMDRCREEKPALDEKTPGHSVRCLLEEPPQ